MDSEILGDRKLLSIGISPYTYISAQQKLTFNSFDLKMTFELGSLQDSVALHSNEIQCSIAEALTDLSLLEPKNKIIPNLGSTEDVFPRTDANVDYVIVTTTDLVDAFKPLAQWKRQKGVKTEIVDIKSPLVQTYKCDSDVNKLKHLLVDFYLQRGLKYVLLAGDDMLVPAPRTFAKSNMGSIYDMPTDMYYACFANDLHWDGNGNGTMGELDDNINLIPYFYVSRIPIRTIEDATLFVTRQLQYEKNPLYKKRWNDNILMAGGKLYNKDKESGKSDAEQNAEITFDNYISPYWSGTRTRFFDTYSDVIDNDTILKFIKPSQLQPLLSSGFTFVDLLGHGNEHNFDPFASWPYYTQSYAESLTNEGYTHITTMSCSTNAFDCQDDPCFSEALIRNPNANIMSYLGASRYGFTTNVEESEAGRKLMVSQQYTCQFYKALFSNEIRNNNYAAVVAVAKAKLAPFCSDHSNNFRWIQFALNPIGDPEMSVYTKTPVKNHLLYSKPNIKIGEDYIQFSTTWNSADVCLMTEKDNGRSYYATFSYDGSSKNKVIRFQNVRFGNADGTTSPFNEYRITISANGRVPETYVFKPLDLLDTQEPQVKGNIELCYPNPTNDSFNVEYEISEDAKDAKIVVSSLSNTYSSETEIDKFDTSKEIDVSNCQNGIYSVSLIVDSQIVVTKKIIKI